MERSSAEARRAGQRDGAPRRSGCAVRLRPDTPCNPASGWLWLLFAACLAAGCGAPAAAPGPPPAGPRADFYQSPVQRAPEAASPLLHALGLPELHQAALAPGRRELRLWPEIGPPAIPRVFVRVVDGGDSAHVERVAYWPKPAPPGFHEAMRRQGCGAIAQKGQTEWCRWPVPTGAAARHAHERLAQMGVWQLEAPAPLPRQPGGIAATHQIDGRSLRVQRLEGQQYRGFTVGQGQMDADSALALLFRFAVDG